MARRSNESGHLDLLLDLIVLSLVLLGLLDESLDLGVIESTLLVGDGDVAARVSSRRLVTDGGWLAAESVVTSAVGSPSVSTSRNS